MMIEIAWFPVFRETLVLGSSTGRSISRDAVNGTTQNDTISHIRNAGIKWKNYQIVCVNSYAAEQSLDPYIYIHPTQ
jgi:hypothetical protein